MRKKTLALILVFIPLMTYSQKEITFNVENLKRPDNLLRLVPCDKVFKNMILSDLSISEWELKKTKIDIPYDIIAQSQFRDSLVTYEYHSFFNGMYRAYSDHRPFVLSPDMIWLLISQGFAQHINNNPEKLRTYFVDFNKKLS